MLYNCIMMMNPISLSEDVEISRKLKWETRSTQFKVKVICYDDSLMTRVNPFKLKVSIDNAIISGALFLDPLHRFRWWSNRTGRVVEIFLGRNWWLIPDCLISVIIIISISNVRHSNVTNNALHDNLEELLHFGAWEINNKTSAQLT
jgi:hypothetical protein